MARSLGHRPAGCIEVRMQPTELAAVARQADTLRVSRAEVIRRAVRLWLTLAECDTEATP